MAIQHKIKEEIYTCKTSGIDEHMLLSYSMQEGGAAKFLKPAVFDKVKAHLKVCIPCSEELGKLHSDLSQISESDYNMAGSVMDKIISEQKEKLPAESSPAEKKAADNSIMDPVLKVLSGVLGRLDPSDLSFVGKAQLSFASKAGEQIIIRNKTFVSLDFSLYKKENNRYIFFVRSIKGQLSGYEYFFIQNNRFLTSLKVTGDGNTASTYYDGDLSDEEITIVRKSLVKAE